MSGNKEQIDVSLIGNDKIEEAIVNIQKAPTEENLVRALSIVRHRMNDKGQLIIAVEPPLPDGKLNLQVIKTEDGQMLGALHDEEVKMHNIMSTLNSYKVQASQLSIGKLDIAKIRRCNEAIKITEDMAKNQAVMVKLAERNVEASMKRLADAVKERKVQEKLKEKAFEQFLQELNAQEMKEIDEVVSFNYNDREEDE